MSTHLRINATAVIQCGKQFFYSPSNIAIQNYDFLI